jgi:hypothetical protein
MILEDIIISRVRVKMLVLFLSNPGTIFHVREIVRRVAEEINAVRRELAHMEKAGMVSKEQRANRLFYNFRKDYPLYYDLMELVGKTSGLGWEIIRNRVKLGKVKFAMISGRYIRNLPKASSTDVDVLIVGNIVLPELAQIVRTEETKKTCELNYTVMTEEEFTFRKKRHDPFVLEILSGSRVMLLGDEEEMISSN